MGWDCTQKADNTLTKLSEACYLQTKSANQYVHNGTTYFFEESHNFQKDGGIAGKIFKLNKSGKVVGESSFRIDGDGNIVKGIGLKELLNQKKAEKGETVTLQVYKYQNRIVYVDSKNKHPDPLKKMLWGWSRSGQIISDFKGMFTRQKKDVKIQLPPYPKGMTARRKQEFRLDAIKTFIKKQG